MAATETIQHHHMELEENRSALRSKGLHLSRPVLMAFWPAISLLKKKHTYPFADESEFMA
jgi:hypothetical protein